MKRLKSGIKTNAKKKSFLRVAALISGAAILFYACENDIETIKAFSSPEDLPVVTAENFETTSIDSGKVRFFLKAPLLQQFDNGGQSFIEFPKGLLLEKYDNNNHIISSITADYAKQFVKEDKWEAKNNVVAVNAQGDTLKTEYLVWEEKAGKIHSDKFVKIITEDQIITGVGFRSNQNLENWRIMKPKGSIYIKAGNSGAKNQRKEPEDEFKKEHIPTINVQKPINIKNQALRK